MLRAYLTPFVIAGLLFLPSCSSSTLPSDEPQAKTECEVIQEISIEKANKMKEALNSSIVIQQQAALTYLYYVVEESKCFSSEAVASAKANIALLLAAIAKR